MGACPVCTGTAELEDIPGVLWKRFSCAACGRHEFIERVQHELGLFTAEQRQRLSSILRAAFDEGHTIRLRPGDPQRFLLWGRAQ